MTCEFSIVFVLFDTFAQSKITELDFAMMKQDVLWFEIIMDDLVLLVVQVLKSTQNLGDDQFAFFFRQLLVMLDVHRQIGSIAQLEDGPERVVIDLDCIILSHYSRVIERSVDLVLSESMLDVIGFQTL